MARAQPRVGREDETPRISGAGRRCGHRRPTQGAGTADHGARQVARARRRGDPMRRREFIAIVAGTATLPALWPHVARGQRVGSMPTIGVLMSVAESDADSQARISAFRQGLAALGWKDGQNVRVEYRWAAGRPDLIEQYASELVALAPAVILANSTPVVAALQRITRSVPALREPLCCSIQPQLRSTEISCARSKPHAGLTVSSSLPCRPARRPRWKRTS